MAKPSAAAAVFLVLACLHTVQSEGVRYRLSGKSNYQINTEGTSIPKALEQAADESCTPIQLSLVGRHGARYPTGTGVKRHDALEKRLITADLTMAYKGLTVPELPKEDIGKLSARGTYEWQQIGSRVRTYFPDLFADDKYDPLTYKFESSYMQRAFASAKAFGRGAFPDTEEVDVSDKLEGETNSDTILRPFDSCPRYVKEIADNKTSDEWTQSKLWRDETPMRHALRALQQRMWPHMKMADMHAMYEACAYELLTRPEGETAEPLVCSAFREPELEALEYDADLRSWWEKGYGYKLTALLSQMLLTEIRNEWHNSVMAQQADQPVTTNPKGIFRFTHAELIMPLFTTLGLFKDDFVLAAETDPELIANRQWNQSKICPMSANVLFVLHGCKESNPKIQLFVNEGLVKLPWCSSTLCPLSEFEDYMHSLCDECTHAAWHSTCTQIRPEHHGEVGIVLLPGGATIPLVLAICLVIYLIGIHWRSKQR